MAKKIEDLPSPNQSRQESYLGAIAGQPGAVMPDRPQSREEEYLEYIATHGGGGGEPAEYLKRINKDDKKEEITITDKIGKETIFPYGGGSGSKNSYASITPIREYAHQTVYTDIDYKGAYEFFEQMKPAENAKVDYKPQGLLKSPIGACSAFYAEGIMCRLYDWNFNEQESIEVITPAMSGRKAVDGTGYNRELIKSVVELGKYNKAFDYVPFELVDGINEDGFNIAMLVVPNDIAATTGTTPSGEVEEEVATIMLPRYLLDRCSTITEAMELLETSVSVYNVMPLIMMGYEVHFFVADATGNHGVIEFINNTPIFHHAEAATNFYIHGVQFNDDGTVYTPATQDETHDAKTTNQITDYGSGLERYNLIIETLKNAKDPEVIEQLLYDLRFTKAYDRNTTPFRYTEFVGNEYKVNTPTSVFDAEGGIVERAIAEFGRRDRTTGTTWQTVHGGMFDIENKKIYLVFQEDMSKIYEFGFNYYTARQVDSLIAAISGGNLKYNEPQNLADSEFNQVMDNLKLGARIDSTSTMETIYDAQGLDVAFDGRAFIVHNSGIRAFNSEKEYEVPLTFGAIGTLNVEAQYKNETMLSLHGGIEGVNFTSLEVAGSDIIISVKTELKEAPHLTGIQINEMTVQRDITPIDEKFIPHDNSKQDKTDNGLVTIDKTVVGAINEVKEITDNKLDKNTTTGTDRVYGVNSDGTPNMFRLSETVRPYSILFAGANGELPVGEATKNTSAVPKSQMDAELAEIRQKIAGFNKGYVINAESQITGEKQSTGEITNVTAIGEVDLTQVIIGDDVFIKEKSVPDYWVSQITPTMTLTPYETKLDLSNYYNIPQIDNLLANKVNITNNASRVYSTDEQGKQMALAWNDKVANWSFPVRNGQGFFEVKDAESDKHPVNLGQLNSLKVPFLLEYADGTTETLNMIAESTSNDNVVEDVDNQGGELDG